MANNVVGIFGLNIQEEAEPEVAPDEKQVAAGGGGPHNPSMEERVTRLETHMEYVRADLSEIKSVQKSTETAILGLVSVVEKLGQKIDMNEVRYAEKIDRLSQKVELGEVRYAAQVDRLDQKIDMVGVRHAAQLDRLPTKADLWLWKFQWLGIALVAFAAIVGGIIGGLDWIKTH